MQTIKTYWRPVLAGLPLPMLALAASYGVYSFALLFVPTWVAVVQAAAFELTYLGLAVLVGLDERQRARARLISVGAVVTSIIYNTLAGWFHQRPELMATASDEAWLALAVLHGMPLAWVAYLVSDLLLHRGHAEPAPAPRDRRDRVGTPQIAPQVAAPARAHDSGAPVNIAPVRDDLWNDAAWIDQMLDEAGVPPAPTEPAPARDYTCRHCGQGALTSAELMAHGRRRKRYGSCQGAQVSAAD
jgi:hypothetical protein